MDELEGIQRAIFGAISREQLRVRLDRHLQARLGTGIGSVIFEAGDIGAVLGLRLADGRDVVLKALRPEADPARTRAITAAQNRIAASGFGCAAVLDGPTWMDGAPLIVEEYLPCTPTGTPHDPAVRAVQAAALARQIDILSGVDGSALMEGRPGWANWESGSWPTPHDPIFDFTTPVPGFQWLDELADSAAAVLNRVTTPPVIGHSDWVWQNVCIRDGVFVAGFDWDSLVFLPESAIVGLSGSAFSQGTNDPPDAPSSEEVAQFIEDYQRASGRRFDAGEQAAAAAAVLWARCYNARCQLDNRERRDMQPPAGSFLEQLTEEYGHASP